MRVLQETLGKSQAKTVVEKIAGTFILPGLPPSAAPSHKENASL